MNNNGTLIKPITLMREDFMKSLVGLCNDSGLPFFIVESIIKDFLQDIHLASQQQLEADRERYNQELLKLQPESTEDSD